MDIVYLVLTGEQIDQISTAGFTKQRSYTGEREKKRKW